MTITDFMLVCQLHGGDIGVSSKEGEGSTFGFFFKVRRSDGASNEDGRPPFGSRSNSENPATPNQRSQTPRPGYSRANSNLQDIKERTNEQGRKEVKMEAKESESEGRDRKTENKNDQKRPGLNKQLTSHSGVDTDDVDPSLKNPPTEYFPESHPESNEDQRYKESKEVADQVSPPVEGHDGLPYSETGESVRQEAAADKAHKAQSTQQKGDKRTLLLVEDNLINQKVLRRQLQTRGFEVFVANNGQEAIDAVAKRSQTAAEDLHNRNYFDCILMDQEMPIKDGNQATFEIRQLQDEGKAGYSKILGVSANVREAQRISMREAGMDDLISKPFKVDALVKKIDELTIGGKDGYGENGKLADEAKQIDTGKQLENGLMKGEQETRDKKKQDQVDGETIPNNPDDKRQVNREKKQTEVRDEDGAVGDITMGENAKQDQPNSNSNTKQSKDSQNKGGQSKEKSGKNQRSPQNSDGTKETTEKGLEQKG